MAFEQALAFTLGWEGGWSDNIEDRGGATNLGVTHETLAYWRQRHPEWDLPADVRNLKRAQAAKIYRAGYWDAIKGDDLPAGVALLAFDAAVNHGPDRARRWLQGAAGAVADGIIGPKTLAAVHEASPLTLIREFATLRALGYVATGQMTTFGKGWMRRLFAAVQEASKITRVA
jgi:lysozyme family protein